MRLPTFYEQNLIPNWGIYYLKILLPIQSKIINFASYIIYFSTDLNLFKQ